MTKTLQIRLDESLRSEADRVLREIGLDLYRVLDARGRSLGRTRGTFFDLGAAGPTVDNSPADAATQAKMDEIGALWRAGKSRRKG